MQTGRLSKAAKARTSIVGATQITQTTEKMPTSDVDHGSASASRTAEISAALVQACGSRQTGDTGLTDDDTTLPFTPGLRGRDRPATSC